MRTTLDLPEALLDEARTLTGCKSKTETIVYALAEVVRRKRVEALKAMLGTVNITTDLTKTRGRRAASPL
jgi:hypothetical protein